MFNNQQLLITGSKGQLGKALLDKYPGARAVDIDELDISNIEELNKYNWNGIKIIINAAAYTNVDGAETPEGRIIAWQANAVAPRNLVKIALKKDICLVHISTDYVFDGKQDEHSEEELFSPLSVYGESKAAGDIAINLLPKHYILRTSWVIGDGKNFVRTMLELGEKGINPSVVDDQIGRLTFTSELVRAIDYLLFNHCEYGTYNVSNSGKPNSWADITRNIFRLAELSNKVTNISTEEYYKDKVGIAPRPLNSTLNLNKLNRTKFISHDWEEVLAEYIKKEKMK